MPDFSVPDWIKPPSPEEQERIDAASAAASRNAYSMIRRGIGVNRMQAEAQQAVQNGVDPVTARQNALLNNAHLIFSDHPEQINSILESRQAEAARQRALLQNQAHLAVTAQHYSNLAEEAKAKLAQQAKIAADALAQKREAAASKTKSILDPSIVQVPDPGTGQNVSVFRRGPNSFEIVKPQPKEKLSEVDQAEIKDIYKRVESLQAAHDAITPEEGTTIYKDDKGNIVGGKTGALPNTIKRMRLAKEIQALKERAKAIQSKVVNKTSGESSSEAKPLDQDSVPKLNKDDVINQGGKRYRFLGGDQNDPKNYAEVPE